MTSALLHRLRSLFGPALAVVLASCLAACDGTGDQAATDISDKAAETAAEDRSFADDAQRVQEAGAWPHEASDVPVDEAVTWGALENGLRYAVLANPKPRNTVALRLFIDAGSMHERDDQRGVAHFLEHMAFKGSDNMPGDEVVKFLEREGLAFGPDTNAYTSFFETVYQLDLPDADEALVRKGLEIFREYAGRLTLDAEAIEKERGVILSELRVRDTPSYRRSKALYSFIAPEALFTERFPIGVSEVISSAPREAFVDFYEGYYRPERMMVVAVGDADPAMLSGLIEEIFADFTREAPEGPEPDIAPVPDRGVAAGHFFDPDISSQVQIFGVGPLLDLDDTVANRREALLRSLGNAILSRRLQSLSQTADAPFLGGSASSFDLLDTANVALVSLTTAPDEWQDALGVAEQELRRALEFGFTQAELNEQLARYESGLVDAVEIAPTRESAALAGGLVSVLSEEAVFSTPQTDLDLFRAAVETFTPGDVDAAFRTMWEGRAPLLFLSGNLEVDDPQAAILAAYETSTQVAVAEPEETGDVAFAYTDFGEPGTVVFRDEVEDLGILRVRFDNNVMLNMKVTDFEAETIHVIARVGGGLLEMPMDKPGLNLLADQAFVNGGFEAHSFDEVIRLYAGVTADLSFGVGSDAFELSGTTDPDDLPQQLNLLAAALTAPGYREEALTRFRKGLDILYDTIDATPGGIVQKDVSRILRSGDIRFGLPPKADTTARTLEEVAAWLAEPLANGHLEIGVVGDFDPDRMIAEVARTFGALPERAAERPAFEDGRKLDFPMLETVQVLRHEGEPNRAASLVYWPTTDASDRIVARRLGMLSAVLRLRLTERMRRETGATYSPNAGSTTSTVFPGYGYLQASLDLEPDVTQQFLDEILEIGGALARDGITDDEFQRARQPMIENIEEQLERNGYWLYSVVMEAQTAPQELEHARTIQADYAGITKADLEAAAQAYLGSGEPARFIILPPEE